jgi:hypothetical protein
MLINDFTAYIGAQKRWIEVRPLYTFATGKWPELTGEYIIYSNDSRTDIGELQKEANQDNSILGSFYYSIEDNISEFKGSAVFGGDELFDLAYLIKSMIVFNYAKCSGYEGTFVVLDRNR